MQSLILAVLTVVLVASSASAESADLSPALFSTRASLELWSTSWSACSDDATRTGVPPSLTLAPMLFHQDPALYQDTAQPVHAAAIEHSDAYLKRKKIHKIASFATLPLFATELALGNSLYNTPSHGTVRAAHIFLGTGIVGLFGVNTVTGAWNMLGEDRQDPSGRMLRLVHGLLMLASDAGFAATSMTGPNSNSQRQALTYESRAATHRNLAIASISVGTAGYLIMLFGETIDVLSQFLDSWASVNANHAALRTGILFMHIGGLLAAGGSAITVDLETIKVKREDPAARAAHLLVLQRTHTLVVAGLAMIVLSGVLQVGADVGTFVASRIFWLKMVLVLLLLVNGVLILGGERQVQRGAPRAWARLHTTATVSLVLWFVITLAGVALTNIG